MKPKSLLLLAGLWALAASQSIRTINGSIVMEIAGATMTLQGAVPSQQAASLLEPAAYFQPQINNLYGVLNGTNTRVDQAASSASAQLNNEISRATRAEASLADSTNARLTDVLAQLAGEASRATTAERSIAQWVGVLQTTVPTTVSAAIGLETSRALTAEAALGVLVGQAQASAAQASSGVAALVAGIDGRFSTAVGALSVVLGGQLGANLAQTATQYSTALFTVNSLATTTSQQASSINTQLSTSIASLSTATATTFVQTTTSLSSAITATVSIAQSTLATTISTTAAALSSGLAATQASGGITAALAAATSTALVGTVTNLTALWGSFTSYATAQSTRVATLATTLTTVQNTVTQFLTCVNAPTAAIANGAVSACTNVPVGGTCTPTCNTGFAPLFFFTCSVGGVWTGTASCGNGLALTTPLASCLAIRATGQTANGTYFVNPIPGGVPFPVFCDMTTDGGGWTFAVQITGFDQNHSNTGQLGLLPLTPTTSYIVTGMTTPMSVKLADNVINALMSNPQGSAASLRFVCGTSYTFIKNCVWRATKGLPSNIDPCVNLYSDPAATVLYSNVQCNAGSQGVGAHCGTNLPAFANAYCSHCVGGDAPGLPPGRWAAATTMPPPRRAVGMARLVNSGSAEAAGFCQSFFFFLVFNVLFRLLL
eukprot:m.234964 g.234964  ORF g.234964 m.234964 type:complete len:661 (-) comp19847_c0_seq1:98-2080(-)